VAAAAASAAAAAAAAAALQDNVAEPPDRFLSNHDYEQLCNRWGGKLIAEVHNSATTARSESTSYKQEKGITSCG
jgi:hypothetical protein